MRLFLLILSIILVQNTLCTMSLGRVPFGKAISQLVSLGRSSPLLHRSFAPPPLKLSESSLPLVTSLAASITTQGNTGAAPSYSKLSKRLFCPTHKGPFRLMMKDSLVRDDFIRTFVPDSELVSSKDVSSNGTSSRLLLPDPLEVYETYANLPDIKTVLKQLSTRDLLVDGELQATDLVKELRKLCSTETDRVLTFEEQEMDVMCEFEYEDQTRGPMLVEIQIIPRDIWQIRKLYYVAAMFNRYLQRRDKSRCVVGISLIKDSTPPDSHCPEELEGITHYRFNYNNPEINPSDTRSILELVQYPIFSLFGSNKLNQEWIKLLTLSPQNKVDFTKASTAIKKAYEILLRGESHESYSLQPLPIGLAYFEDLRANNYVYVDKTATIYELVKQAKQFYFLTRPRRFGKTLLCRTIQALFEGKRELFKGLAIDKLWDWSGERTNPVIYISMSSCETTDYTDLEKRMLKMMESQVKIHKIQYTKTSVRPSDQLQDLIESLYERTGKQVVILIDEYDNPLHPFIGRDFQITLPDGEKKLKVAAALDQLADFYGVLKDNEDKILFLLLTGVSRIPKTNLFSKLNNLRDITFNPLSSTLVGYTHKEVQSYFYDYLQRLAETYGCTKKQIFEKLIEKYNGYRFHVNTAQVFNPFSLMQVLKTQKFENYWYTSGSPTMLVNFIKKNPFIVKDIFESFLTSTYLTDGLKLEDPDITCLMLQTGYLTLKKREGNIYLLCSPNKEIRTSLIDTLTSELTHIAHRSVAAYGHNIRKALIADDLQTALENFKSFVYSIPYYTAKRQERENQIQLIFHVVMNMTGFCALLEMPTLLGRVDAVLDLPNTIYIIEFKIDEEPTVGLDQIKAKQYFAKYLSRKDKQIKIVGISVLRSTKPKAKTKAKSKPETEPKAEQDIIKWKIQVLPCNLK